MKILQVRFKNLNSLAGEWRVDFTHPAYSSDGIFAIVGPTGAGKTTLLDAICLALYGRTPRLNRVSKANNELMSRQTGECLAEVTFQTQAGSFRCCWGQHRSRKKSSGELQNPRHEIVNADTGVVIDSSLRGVAERIEALTGMDFDRFTRSMLLAQGGFAAFLQAAADQRAPLLEQITGTEIYSDISVRVHEIRSAEHKKLESLNAETKGIQLLDTEQEQALNIELQDLSDRDAAVIRQCATVQLSINWIEGISRLELELQQLAQKKRDLQARHQAFAVDLQRLKWANLALELAGNYAALCALRQQQAADQQTLNGHRATQPAIESEASQAELVMQLATAALSEKQTAQKQALPIIRQARELDLLITGTAKPIQLIRRELAELSSSQQALVELQQHDVRERDQQRAALDSLLVALDADRADEKLVQQLAGLEERFNALKALYAGLLSKQEALEQARVEQQKVADECRQQAVGLATAQQGVQDGERKLQQKHAELATILGGATLGDWRTGQAMLVEQQHQLRSVREAAGELLELRQQLTQLAIDRTKRTADKSSFETQHKIAGERQRTLERELELLETQRDLVDKIEDLVEARSQLADGEPCPLCGAPEHPYARGNIPTGSVTRQQLDAAKDSLKTVMAQLGRLDVSLARVGSELERMNFDEQQLCDTVIRVSRSLQQPCAALSIELDPENTSQALLDRVDKCIEQHQKSLQQHTGKLQSAESLEAAISELHNGLEKCRRDLVMAEQIAQASEFNRRQADELLLRLQQELDASRLQQQQAHQELQQQLQVHGIEELAMARLDDIYQQLDSRRERWLARQAEKIKLQQQLVTLELQIQHRSEQLQQTQASVTRNEQHLEEREQERSGLVDSRRQLFADRDPALEEARHDRELTDANLQLEQARQTLGDVQQQLQQLKTRIESLSQVIGARDRELLQVDADFAAQLAIREFADEAHYQSACLQQSEREQLAKLARELADELTAIAASQQEKSNALDVERAKEHSERPLPELQAELVQLQHSQRELQQQIGAIQHRLQHNDSLKQRHRQQQQAIEAQRLECSRWDQLHQLIGSADGKKYRNFAQGLTFDIMIAHANARLQKMTDRYLLVRDSIVPLELCVLDNYQAGEIRSTKNLSGGESFIVSLALALGLSRMASKKVRVDSLFLDEGFGTLDEEALDTALETLVSLQQDGKLIGVISHVPALKERIATQIKITPRAGGKSEMSGPGCSSLVPGVASD